MPEAVSASGLVSEVVHVVPFILLTAFFQAMVSLPTPYPAPTATTITVDHRCAATSEPEFCTLQTTANRKTTSTVLGAVLAAMRTADTTARTTPRPADLLAKWILEGSFCLGEQQAVKRRVDLKDLLHDCVYTAEFELLCLMNFIYIILMHIQSSTCC